MAQKNTYRIILEPGLDPAPQRHELAAARIIAEHFKSDVTFLRRGPNHSPDLRVENLHQIWELKSPQGNSKHTIANNLRKASGQSKNIILDLSRCKMNNDRALSRIVGFLDSGDAHLRHLVVIDKRKKVLTII